MIVFDLGCDNGHRFEGWFASSAEFDRQKSGQLLECPVCGSLEIERKLTAARLNTGRAEVLSAPEERSGQKDGQYANFDTGQMLRMVRHVLENTENVGAQFPEEARKIHYGESPQRHIRGVATAREADALRDEGIDVVSLPVPKHLADKSH